MTRPRYVPVWRQAEPFRDDAARSVREILVGLLVVLAWVLALWLIYAIAVAGGAQ